MKLASFLSVAAVGLLAADLRAAVTILAPLPGESVSPSFNVVGAVDPATTPAGTVVTVTVSTNPPTTVAAKADLTGHWQATFTGVPPGTYTITARLPGGGSDTVAGVTVVAPALPQVAVASWYCTPVVVFDRGGRCPASRLFGRASRRLR